MLRYRIAQITVTMPVSSRDQLERPRFSRPNSPIKQFLEQADLYGVYGHTFDIKNTTAIDLDKVLRETANRFGLKLRVLEGADLVSSYEADIPEGAVT